MFKLTIVTGPGRGTSYAAQQGELQIGRQSGCDIVLASGKVSKKHCKIQIKGSKVFVSDGGSANGTFVNGVLVKERILRPGDRIGIGEFVLELRHVSHQALGKALPFPVQPPQPSYASSEPPPDYIPADLPGKIRWGLEKYVMPFFYSLYFKYDWKVLSSSVLGVFALASVILSTWPLVEEDRKHVLMETIRRTQFMAKTLMDRNVVAVSEGMETKTDLGRIPNEPGVRYAVLVDLNGRIIAPHNKMNQQFTGGAEARFLAKKLPDYRNGYERSSDAYLGDNIVVSIEPVKVFVPSAARNAVVALALVSIDATLTIPGLGALGVSFSQALAVTAILAIFFGMVLLRLSLKPLEILNEDMDKALKGELRTVTRTLKHEEMIPLWDLLDSVIQRLDTSGKKSDDLDVMRASTEDAVAAVRAVSGSSQEAIAVVDASGKLLYANHSFEEITGIRAEAAIGSDLISVARDQAFGALIKDVIERASLSPVRDDFDFSGVPYQVRCEPLGVAPLKGFILALSRANEEAA